jgi:hypothetical protein
MPTNELIASVQYGDAKGTTAIDWHDSMNAFATACGVDKDRFFPVAVEVYNSEGFESVSIYAVDCQTAGDTADKIAAYAQAHNNTLPVRKFSTEVSLDELIRHTKRFSLVAINRLVPSGCQFET